MIGFIGFKFKNSVFNSRLNDTYTKIEDYEKNILEDSSTPVGIIQEYTFSLSAIPHSGACLAFYTVHQYVEVYLDNELVYSLKPQDTNLFGKTTACNWTMIDLYEEDEGSIVYVKIIPVYEGSIKRIPEFFVGKALSIYVECLKASFWRISISVAAILIGIGFIGWALLRLKKKNFDIGILMLGIFSLAVGMWKLTDTYFSPFMFSKNTLLLSYISISMLLIIMVPLMLMIQNQFQCKKTNILSILSIGVCGLIITLLMLQIMNKVDLRESLVVTHIGIIISFGAIVVELINEFRRNKLSLKLKVTVVCILICIACTVLDLIFYYRASTSNAALWGLVAFLVYMFIMTYMYFRDSIAKELEQQVKLQEANSELRQRTVLNEALSYGYTSYEIIDWNDDTCSFYQVTTEDVDIILDQLVACNTYEKAVKEVYSKMIHPDDLEETLYKLRPDVIREELSKKRRYDVTFRRTLAGKINYVQMSHILVERDNGRKEFIVASRNVDELMEMQKKIYLDQLTGLSNRNALYDYFEKKVANLKGKRLLYLLLIDANKFKQINDTYGHNEGDKALVRISQALEKISEETNSFVSRHGGDEFIMLCEVESQNQVDDICDKIHMYLNKLNREDHTPYELSVSIGYSEYTSGSILDLVEAADKALYKDKKNHCKSKRLGT